VGINGQISIYSLLAVSVVSSTGSGFVTRVRILVTRKGYTNREPVVVQELIGELGSRKRLTANRAARALAQNIPGFRRRKGRFSRFSGVEVLPIMETTGDGWRAWRLHTGDDLHSGYESPLPGRVGKANLANNPLADRASGVWERADVLEVVPLEPSDGKA
jgi:hypothetical protein